MKRFAKYIVVLLMGALALVGCCDDEPKIEKQTPQIIAQTFTNGMTNVAAAPRQVLIVFDRPVKLNRPSEVYFAPEVAIEVEVSEATLKINMLESLEYDCDYTLTIGSGVVVDKATGGENNERKIAFHTEEGPYVAPSEPATRLANKSAMAVAQQVYDYLWAVYGTYTLSSASLSPDMSLDECEWVYKWTGSYPAILNLDYQYLQHSPSGVLDYTDIRKGQVWWYEGGLISASWHWMVPVRDGQSNYTCDASATTLKVRRMFTEGTWENRVMNAGLEEMASILLLYKEAGIPILWRPLHEAAGNIYTSENGSAWYWWGADGAEAYKQLWHTMFDYFRSRGVDNLIWVWNTRQGDTDYYPGDDYVDIVACDLYNTLSPQALVSTMSRVEQIFPHRMLALCEMGKLATIPQQLNGGATWLYFMPCYDEANDKSESFAHSYASMDWWREAMASDRVITREKVPAFVSTQRRYKERE